MKCVQIYRGYVIFIFRMNWVEEVVRTRFIYGDFIFLLSFYIQAFGGQVYFSFFILRIGRGGDILDQMVICGCQYCFYQCTFVFLLSFISIYKVGFRTFYFLGQEVIFVQLYIFCVCFVYLGLYFIRFFLEIRRFLRRFFQDSCYRFFCQISFEFKVLCDYR